MFLDVVESVNMLANSAGTVLRSEIVGAIKMRVYLTGMPELRLGLNDKVCTMCTFLLFHSFFIIFHSYKFHFFIPFSYF